MILDKDNDSPGEARTIAVAVLTAALTSLATGLVTWAIDEMKDRRKRTPNEGGDT